MLAEGLAALFFFFKGYKVLHKRYKTNVGEIDLIVQKGDTIIFAEVKSRGDMDTAAYSITPKQKTRIINAAKAWQAKNPKKANNPMRFDAVLMRGISIPHHIKNAWQVEERF